MASSVKDDKRRLRLGIAGLGVASTYIFPGAETSPVTEIYAAADLRRSALDAFAAKYKARTYKSVAELCADPNVDVVWIATPNQLHCEHTILAAERNHVKLLCGQTWSMSPDMQAMAKVAHSGALGRLIAVNNWFYTDWLLKPRVDEELDEHLGGGVIYRHAPHLIDTVRLLGGGRVKSVRAMAGRWMKERPCPGNFSAYLEFEDGTPATIVYNGYGYFDTSELTWDIGNRMYSDAERVPVRQALHAGKMESEAAKEGMRFGAAAATGASRGSALETAKPVGTRAHIHWFGLTLASFERGDLRQSPNGLYIYDDNGRREVPVEGGRGVGTLEMQEMHDAIFEDAPIVHDGRWAAATLEVALAIVQSGRERREVMLSHQCALPGVLA